MRDYHGGEVTGYLRGSHSLMGEVKSWSLEDPRLIVDDFEIQLVIPKLLTKLTNIMMKIKDDSKFPRCGHVCCVGGAMWFSPRREISSSSGTAMHIVHCTALHCTALHMLHLLVVQQKKNSIRYDSVFETELEILIQYDSVLITF